MYSAFFDRVQPHYLFLFLGPVVTFFFVPINTLEIDVFSSFWSCSTSLSRPGSRHRQGGGGGNAPPNFISAPPNVIRHLATSNPGMYTHRPGGLSPCPYASNVQNKKDFMIWIEVGVEVEHQQNSDTCSYANEVNQQNNESEIAVKLGARTIEVTL